MDLNGNGSEIVISDKVGYFTIFNNEIYYTDEKNKGSICVVPLSDLSLKRQLTYGITVISMITSGGIQFALSGNIYFLNELRTGLKAKVSLSRINIHDNTVETIIENLVAFNIDGNRLFTMEGKNLIQYSNFEVELQGDILQTFEKAITLPLINICGDDIHICKAISIYADDVYTFKAEKKDE